jgi:DNA-binding CsgD family transcriptional regulator
VGIVRYTALTHQLVLRESPGVVEFLGERFHALLDERTIDLLYRQGHTILTASSSIVPIRVMKLLEKMVSPFLGSTPDIFSVICQTGTGECVSLSALLKERRDPTALERKRWPQVAAHIGAGLRLRNKLRNLSKDALPVEAVLDSQGRMHDGDGPATGRDSRENLRDAVLRIERARTKAGRSEPDAALDNWEALVDGRWSLVDRFDSDGKRYVIAVINDPAHPDPRGLTAQERQEAELVGLARSKKQISYALGVSNSAVTNCTSRIQTKLGLSSQVELVSFFSPAGPRRKLAEVAVAGERLLVGAYPLIDERMIDDLTEAERNVMAQIIAGSNADIARRREASEHTVANQVQAIFRKLEVRSRSELAARLGGDR